MPHKGQIFNNSHGPYANVRRQRLGRDKDSIRLSWGRAGCPPERTLALNNFLSLLNLHLGRHFNAPADDDDGDGLVVKYFDISQFSFLFFFFFVFLTLHALSWSCVLPSTPTPTPQNADNVFSLYYIYFDSHRIRLLSLASFGQFMKFECCLNFLLYGTCFSANPRRRLIS